MITARPDTYVHSILTLLSVVGEFPTRSLSILGKTRPVKYTVHLLTTEQKVRLHRDAPANLIRVLSISNRAKLKTVRLTREGVELLKKLHPGAFLYYMHAFSDHHFTGDANMIDRNHRVAEAVAMCMRVGAEVRPYALPPLQMDAIRRTVPDGLSCYPGKEIKRLENMDVNKIGFTRIVGLLFAPEQAYALYNVRNAVMKWSGTGEYKAFCHVQELVLKNAPELPEPRSAILFGTDGMKAIETLLASDRENRTDTPLTSIYRHLHFVPLNEEGVRLMRILVQPGFRERMLDSLFPDKLRVKGYADCECGAMLAQHRILSHLDGDVGRLIRFKKAIQSMPTCTFEVVCYPWQVAYVTAFMKTAASVKTIRMEAIESVFEKEG